jgi:two-component system phosphate regulon sensor histidine kinase PhoR
VKKIKLIWKLILPFLAVTAVLLLVQTVFLTISTRSYIIGFTQSNLIRDSLRFGDEIRNAYISNDAGLKETLAKTAGILNARISVVLTNGDVYADSQGQANLPNISGELQKHRLLQSTPQTVVTSIFGSQEKIVCSIPILEKQDLLAVILVQAPMVEVSEVLSRLGNQIFLVLLLSILLAMLAIWLVAKYLTLEFQPLHQGLEKFASGDLSFRIRPLGTLELSQLAQGMNSTADRLKQNIDSLNAQKNMLDAVLESMTEGVMAIGENEKLIGMNGAACRMLDVNVENVRGKMMQEITRSVPLLSFIKKSLESNQAVEDEIAVMADSERLFRVQSSILDKEAGQGGIIVVLSEVTDVRRLEGIRKDFVANVSHELRTPITSIKGFVETLISGADRDPQDRTRFLQIIQKHTIRLNRIIEDMLELSAIEEASQKNAIEFDVSDISIPIKSAISFLESKALEKGIKIEASVESGMCRINPSLIEHAVSNYVDNAINFSQSETCVTVTGRIIGEEYVLTVKDQGQGMEKRHLPRIFERFYRAQSGRDRNSGGGTGLGLAIVKHIIGAHGGRVWADSELGAGSTFSFSIPLPKNS